MPCVQGSTQEPLVRLTFYQAVLTPNSSASSDSDPSNLRPPRFLGHLQRPGHQQDDLVAVSYPNVCCNTKDTDRLTSNLQLQSQAGADLGLCGAPRHQLYRPVTLRRHRVRRSRHQEGRWSLAPNRPGGIPGIAQTGDKE